MSTTTRPTKAERREAARREAARLAAQEAATKRRSRVVVLIAAVLAVLLVGGAASVIHQASKETPLSAFDGPTPANATDNGGIAFGAGAVPGEVIDGVPRIDLYTDFLCPYCGYFEDVNGADLVAMLEAEQATLVVHPLHRLDRAVTDEYSLRAASAFVLITQEAPESALPFMSALLAAMPETAGGTGLTDAEIAGIAVASGVPAEVADMIAEGRYTEWVRTADRQALEDDVTGTPFVFIDGERWEGDWTVPGALVATVTGQQ